MARFLGTDAESGGLDDDGDISLLTAYFVALDEKLNPIDDLYIRMKPLNGIYHCTAKALEVNKINLIEHDKIAEYPEECMKKILDFVKLHSENGATRLTPIGHNVAGDIRWYKDKIMRRPNMLSPFLDYRCLDTCAVATFLKLTNKIPPKMLVSLESLAKFFKIPPGGHDAKGDTWAAIEVLKEFIKLINPALKPEELAMILGIDPYGADSVVSSTRKD